MDSETPGCTGEEAPRLRVLIVDDEPMLRSVIEEFLLLLDYEETRMAQDGREALKILREEHFDCMISDIKMPEMALEDLLPYVAKEFPRLIVIATSGHSDFDNALNIIDCGAHDFLGKPLNLDALELALDWVGGRRPVLELAEKLFGPEADPTAGTPDERLDTLSEALSHQCHAFRVNMEHSRRVAELARALRPAEAVEDWRELELAALLHEMGSSHIMQTLVEQPRRLDASELRLVRAHALISGRLAANYLGRPSIEKIIGDHFHWDEAPAEGAAPPDRERGLANWLGLLNFVDGCLRTRADRMPYSRDQVRESLRRRFQATGLAAIGELLGRWDRLEARYDA